MTITTSASSGIQPNQRVQAFYYGWYGNTTTDGHWDHWNQGSHTPPDDIGSDYYPQLGAYSSTDRATVAQHMAWAAQSGIGVLIYEWWGRNDTTNAHVPLIMEEAAKRNIQIAWIIAPYSGRTPASVVSDIHYLYNTYGSSPAFFRVSRPTKYGNTTTPRGVFYIWNSSSYSDLSLASQWRAALDPLHADPTYNGIVLGLGTDDPCFIDGCNDLNRESHFDGLYSYGGDPHYSEGYKTQKAALDARNSIYVPSVMAGASGVRSGSGATYQPRYNANDCARSYSYDCMWASTIAANPEWVSITSFNEWMEGTAIEPAVSKSANGFTYMDYQSLPGGSPTVFLDKTAINVARYLATLGITWHSPQAYRIAGANGTVVGFNNSGNAAINGLQKPIVAITSNHLTNDYWLTASDGGVFAFGGAEFYGSTGGIVLNKPVVGMAATPSGHGYWLVASDGGIFAFGDAQYYGSTGNMTLNKPVVGIAGTPSGHGYWLVASDGGIFAFGDAQYYGSTGNMTLNKPVVGITATPTGHGYSIVASDGGIFAFGDAQYYGSTGAITLNKPVVGIAGTNDGSSYWMVASDGGVFAFGDASFLGNSNSLGPVVGIAIT